MACAKLITFGMPRVMSRRDLDKHHVGGMPRLIIPQTTMRSVSVCASKEWSRVLESQDVGSPGGTACGPNGVAKI